MGKADPGGFGQAVIPAVYLSALGFLLVNAAGLRSFLLASMARMKADSASGSSLEVWSETFGVGAAAGLLSFDSSIYYLL